MDDLNGSFYINNQDINMTKSAKEILAFYGDDDPNIPQNYLEKFAAAIGGQAICVKNAGHFNASAGYLQFDDILNTIKQFNAK